MGAVSIRVIVKESRNDPYSQAAWQFQQHWQMLPTNKKDETTITDQGSLDLLIGSGCNMVATRQNKLALGPPTHELRNPTKVGTRKAEAWR